MTNKDNFNHDAFSEEVSAEVDALDLSDELFAVREEAFGLTIDSATSKDLDDAIFIKRQGNCYQVQVSIADVASLVQPDSVIYQEALNRVETQYRSDYNIPMIPRSLSEDRLSLLAHQRRPAITFYTELGDDLQVRRVEIRETYICSKRKLNYPQVDEIISSKPHDPDYGLLVECNNLAHRLLDKRRNQGALAIYDLKRHLFTDEEGHIMPLEGDRANKGHLIVQEFMILTNQAAAKFFAEKNIPFLFRNHTVRQSTPQREDIIAQFNAAIINTQLLENLSQRAALWFDRATYDPVLKGHFGLNEVAYAHLTSPIRRVADLINQHIIKAYINNQEPPYQHEELVDLSQYINSKIAETKDARSEYFKQKAITKARYQATHSNIDGLVDMDAADFRQVLKQACRTGIVGDDFEHALMTRFEMDRIDVSHLYTIFFDMVGSGGVWGRIRDRALAYANENPGYNSQLLNLQTQKGNLSRYEVEIKQGQQGFLARVVAASNDGVVSTPFYARGLSKKEAQHKASYNFLVGYLEHSLVPPEKTQEPEEEALISVVSENINDQLSEEDVEESAIDGENYVGQLNELCAGKAGWSMPRYTFEKTGPPHQPQITSECTLETGWEPVKTTGNGKSKKVAKQVAAHSMLELIFREGIVFSDTASAKAKPQENYVGDLNEMCQRYHWPLPAYRFEQSGPPHNPHFTCTVAVQMDEGIQEVTGSGPSKKVAKQMAAQNCLEHFNNGQFLM